MLKVTQKLKVDADAFFTVLENSLKYDAEHNASKKVDLTKIGKGFKYSRKYKQGKKTFQGTITIQEFERPKHYKAKLLTEFGGNLMEYMIEEVDGGIRVTYQEEALDADGDPKKKLTGLNAFLNMRTLKKQLKRMEHDILNPVSEEE